MNSPIAACTRSRPTNKLLRPARDDIDALSPARRDGLRSAFGQGTGPVPRTLLVAARDGYQLPLLDAGLTQWRLGGLAEDAANEPLDAVAPALATAARREILDISLGIPLALHELSQSVRGPDRLAADELSWWSE
jgi:hypothetical protein